MSLVTAFFSLFFLFFVLFLLLSPEQLLLLALISPWWETSRLASGLTLTFKRASALLSVSQLMSSIHAAAICNSARSISFLRCGEEEERRRDGDTGSVHDENAESLSEHTHAVFWDCFFPKLGLVCPHSLVICSSNTSKIASLHQMKSDLLLFSVPFLGLFLFNLSNKVLNRGNRCAEQLLLFSLPSVEDVVQLSDTASEKKKKNSCIDAHRDFYPKNSKVSQHSNILWPIFSRSRSLFSLQRAQCVRGHPAVIMGPKHWLEMTLQGPERLAVGP